MCVAAEDPFATFSHKGILNMAAAPPTYKLSLDEIDKGVRATSLVYDDILIEPNFKMQITGPSMSGKSAFILKLVEFRANLFKQNFRRIIYCHPSAERTAKNENYLRQLQDVCEGIEIILGLPSLDHIQTGDDTLVSAKEKPPKQTF
jgi:hypothetical protein